MEPVFSTRLSIQWGDKEVSEDTSTWVLTASDCTFVDARIDLKTGVPQWLVVGTEVEIPTKEGYECSIKFVPMLDSLNDKENVEDFAECGHFKPLPDGTRLETGSMLNPGTNEVEPYREIWRTLDPINSTSDSLLSDTDSGAAKQTKSIVWNLSDDSSTIIGKFIIIGKFSQGIVKYNKTFQCIRICNNEVVYQYGSNVEEIFGQFIKGLSTFNAQFPWVKASE